MIPITKDSLRKLSTHLDGMSINSIVEGIFPLIRNFSIIRYGKYDLSTTLDSLSMYIQMSNSQIVHLKERSTQISDNAQSWDDRSLVLEELFKTIFRKFVNYVPIRFKTTDDSIIASLVLESL